MYILLVVLFRDGSEKRYEGPKRFLVAQRYPFALLLVLDS